MTQATGPGWDYLLWFYNSNVWRHISYRGIRTLKFPPDMWNYQEIICEHKIEWIIETGTRHGGSALFFADLLRSLGGKGKVITIDPIPEWQYDPATVDNLVWIKADSGSPETAKEVFDKIPAERGAVFLILDSDHTHDHVLRELNVFVPHLKTGDYVVVEDTIINGHIVRPDFGPGAMEAIKDFLAVNPGRLMYDSTRADKFGATFAMRGFFHVP